MTSDGGGTGWSLEVVGALVDQGVMVIGDGYRAKNSELASEGVPFARAGNIRGGINTEGADLLSVASVEKAAGKLSQPGDVIFTSKGTVGRFAFVRESDPVVAYSPQVCFWRSLDHDRIDPRFLYFWMHGDECRSQFNKYKGQTDMADYISLRDQRLIEVSLPPIEEQRRIAGVLGALEAASDAARMMSEHLRTAVRGLFQHAVETATDGAWEEADLTAIARFVNGRNFTKGAAGTGRPVLRIKELRSGLGESTVYAEAEAAEEHVAYHFDLLFAWSGTLGVHRWDGPTGLVNQHIFKVLPHPGYPLWFVECWVERHLPEFVAIARDKATTMGHIQRKHLAEAEIVLPSPEDLSEWDGKMRPLDELRAVKAREAGDLRRTLDELLPLVVSGKLRVAEDYLADVNEPVAV